MSYHNYQLYGDILVYRSSAKSNISNLQRSYKTLAEAEAWLQQFRTSISTFYVCDQRGTKEVYDFDKTTGKLVARPEPVFDPNESIF